MISGSDLSVMGFIVLLVHALGILNAAHAVMNVRLSQSAIAWSLSLITFPWLAIPLYWVLGRRKFHGYADAYRQAYAQYHDQTEQIYQDLSRYISQGIDRRLAGPEKLAAKLTDIPFTAGNSAQLLVDGAATYESMLAAIQQAESYILFQFYIINDDEAGQQFQQALIQKAQQGVRVYVLYDEIGSKNLSRTYVRRFKPYGIQVSAFNSTRGMRNRFQLNFRNHRKILVIDGEIGFTGGLNIGNEYLGKDHRYGPWRDTHVRLQGPAVKTLQLSFLKDWYWAMRTVPAVQWSVQQTPEQIASTMHPTRAHLENPILQPNETVLVLPTGPADELQACTLFFNSLINLAQSRLWIATPYFVPDEPTLASLKIAALRGVDVRILLPSRPDHLIVYLCAFSYYAELQTSGIQLYRYRTGFMHQKVILVDELLAGVGTVNLDNRSFLLNFEVMTFLTQGAFLQQVEAMLKADLQGSDAVDLSEYDRKPFWFRLAVRTARLMAPLQ